VKGKTVPRRAKIRLPLTVLQRAFLQRVFAAGAAILSPACAWSQIFESGPSVLGLEPSARSAAMGHTGAAVFWGAFPEYYWNPALLGHHRGVRYEWSSTQLLPDFVDDFFFRANRLTLGDWGFGATLSGQPLHGLGGTYMDFGENTLTDLSGQPIGTYHPFEEINTWGIGVNGAELAENLFGPGQRGAHPISRFGDVSYGFASKDVEAFYLPETAPLPEIRGRMTTHDHGLLVRLTPYDSIDNDGFLPGFDHAIAPLAGGFRLDFSYGRSWINDEEETLDFTDGDSNPVARVQRQGYALRAMLGLPSGVESELEARDAPWLASALTPLLSVGFAWDEYQGTYREPGGVESEGPEFHSDGIEVTLFNVFSIRRGAYDVLIDEGEANTRNTWGYGLGFHVPQLGGVYFDRGEVSLVAGLANHEPTAFGFWVDPPGLWRALKSLAR
jgi:hypothetical protein